MVAPIGARVRARKPGVVVVSLLALLTAMLTGTLPASAAPAPSAKATFVDYAQCANGAPPSTSLACPDGWLQGILQASNSHYSEDEVTPQRAEVVVPAGSNATGRTMTFSYQARKATTHAYDSLATWNYTQTRADRCQGLAPPGT